MSRADKREPMSEELRDRLGKEIDSTRPGPAIALLAFEIVQATASTAQAVDRLISALEQSAKQERRLSKVLIGLTVALVLATLLSALVQLLVNQG